MNSFTKRLALVLAFTALAIIGLVGCGPAEPTSAKEVIERYVGAKNRDNYHTDATITIEASVLGQTLSIPMTVSSDTAGDRSHSTTTTEFFGESTTQESYAEKDGDAYIQYTSSTIGDTTTWYRSKTSTGSATDEVVSSIVDESLLDDAAFEKTDDGYKVTVDAAVVTDVLRKASSAAGSTGVLDLSQLIGTAKASDAVITFDANCLPTSATLTVSLSGSANEGDDSDGTMSLLSGLADFSMDMNITFGGYGEVDEASVVVPDDVKDSASDLDALTDATGAAGGAEDAEDASAMAGEEKAAA